MNGYALTLESRLHRIVWIGGVTRTRQLTAPHAITDTRRRHIDSVCQRGWVQWLTGDLRLMGLPGFQMPIIPSLNHVVVRVGGHAQQNRLLKMGRHLYIAEMSVSWMIITQLEELGDWVTLDHVERFRDCKVNWLIVNVFWRAVVRAHCGKPERETTICIQEMSRLLGVKNLAHVVGGVLVLLHCRET